MKKRLLAAVCLLTGLMLTGCGEKPPEKAEITFFTDIAGVEVWIAPQTEGGPDLFTEGAPTVTADREGEQRLSLDALGGPGLYGIMAYDPGGGVYSAEDVPLEAGAVLRLVDRDYPAEAKIEVTDAKGKTVYTCSAFAGLWGGDVLDDLDDLDDPGDGDIPDDGDISGDEGLD